MALAQDLAAVEALVARAYGPYVALLGVRPGPLDDDYAARIERRQAMIVERDGRLMGLLVLIALSDALLLDNIAVSPEAQGLGLGRELLTCAEGVALARGLDRIRLYTHELMTRNQMIYARAGYRETQRATERGLRRVYMEKRLR